MHRLSVSSKVANTQRVPRIVPIEKACNCAEMAEGTSSVTGEEAGEHLVNKKGGTSAVWTYFGFAKNDVEQKSAKCKICRRAVARSRGNTTNLYQHLKNHHRQQYDACTKSVDVDEDEATTSHGKSKQPSIKTAFASVTPYEKSSRRHSEITTAITRYIAKEMIPLNTVSGEGFQNLVHTLDRRYVVPSRTYFSQVAVPQMYAECRGKLEAELRSIGYFATTSDLWSSRTTEPYISLTLHFIDDEFHLKSRCLTTTYFPEEHTGENIASAIKEILMSWGLCEKNQTCITTDNAANVIKAAELNEWMRLQCFGHRLHLAIGKILSFSPTSLVLVCVWAARLH